MYTQHTSIKRPFTNETWSDFQPQVVEMMARNAGVVSSKSDYQNLDYLGWSKESYDIGITLYDNIEMDVALPQSYLDSNVVVAEERITLAGYRLAYITEYMFPATEELFLQ